LTIQLFLRLEYATSSALEKRISLKSSFGWYDVTVRADADPDFLRRSAGHLDRRRLSFARRQALQSAADGGANSVEALSSTC